MRRSLAIARYLFPIHIDIVPGPADDNNTNRDTWMNTLKGRERAKREALNIVGCVKMVLFQILKYRLKLVRR